MFFFTALMQLFVFGGVWVLVSKALFMGLLWMALYGVSVYLLQKYLSDFYKTFFISGERPSNARISAPLEEDMDEVDKTSTSSAKKGSKVDITLDHKDKDKDTGLEDLLDLQGSSAGAIKASQAITSSQKEKIGDENNIIKEIKDQDDKTLAKAVRHFIKE